MTQQPRIEKSSSRRGFTIVEVVVAMMIMTIAVLALASTNGLVSKMMITGHNAEMASAFATRRMEQLRRSGCAARADAADTLYRGASTWAAVNNWVWTDAGRSTWRIKMTTQYRSTGGLTKTHISETSISCIL